MQHTEHFTAVLTLFGLISSVYRDLHHWRWLIYLASLICSMDQWLSDRISALHAVVASLNSSGGDHADETK